MATSRFHDGKHGATYRVRVFVFGRELRVTGEDNATIAVWRTDQVRAAPERDPEGAVMLSVRDQPGVLLVDDTTQLEDLRRAGIKLPGRSAWTRGRWLGIGVGFLAIVATGVLAVNALPRWLAAAMPLAWDRVLGQSAKALIAPGRRCVGTEGQAALDHFVERLRTAGGITTPVTIEVFDNKLVNAFTLPGGQVLVMRGLFGEARDAPMLAGVIAHELGHVAHRDPTTLLLRGLGLSIVLNMIGFGDTGSAAAGGASNLLNLAYTRAAEAAADDTAIDLLTKTGLRADGLARFFARMERLEEHDGKAPEGKAGTASGWLKTHPPSETRRERTARPEVGEAPFNDDEFEAIVTMCDRK